MPNFHTIPNEEFSSLFDRIGNDWMLITASDGECTNSMTASWGCFGILWNKPVAVCFIRPQRYTFGLTERADHLSLSFFDREYHKALAYMGAHSGRDGDKYAATGLHIYEDENGTPYVAEAHTVVLCKKLYAGQLQKEAFLVPEIVAKHYPEGDFHRMYVCEIEQILVREA